MYRTDEPKNAIETIEALSASGDTNGLLRNSEAKAKYHSINEFSSCVPEQNMSCFAGAYHYSIIMRHTTE